MSQERDKALLLAKKEKIETDLHKYDGYHRMARKMYFHSLREEVRNYERLEAISFALQLVDGKTCRELDRHHLALHAIPTMREDRDQLMRDVESPYINVIIQAVTTILQLSLPICKKSIVKYIKW